MGPKISPMNPNRDIVLHGSRFVNENVMNNRGLIGNSLGCPAVPYGVHSRIIDVIKGGSCFYINAPDDMYRRVSTVLNARFDLDASAVALQHSQAPLAEVNQLGSMPQGSTSTLK